MVSQEWRMRIKGASDEQKANFIKYILNKEN